MNHRNFRHEWKHEISYSDLITLRHRLSAVCQRDKNAFDGQYQIRSLYFDNGADKALREKLDSVNRREKFRLRMYNGDTSFIRLEKKSKFHGVGTKQQSELTIEETGALIGGDYAWMIKNSNPLVRELYSKIMSQGLRPKTIVDYTREPYFFEPGNVRVTLDYNIRTGLDGTDFLNQSCITIPSASFGSPIILEVKWDEFLPSLIRDLVQLKGRRTSAFSKYAACRIYG